MTEVVHQAYLQLRVYLQRAGYDLPTLDFEVAKTSWEGEFSTALDFRTTHATRLPLYVHFCQWSCSFKGKYIGAMINNFRNAGIVQPTDMVVFVWNIVDDKKVLALWGSIPQQVRNVQAISFFSYQELQVDLQQHHMNPVKSELLTEAETHRRLSHLIVLRNLRYDIGPIFYLDPYVRTLFARPGDFLCATIAEPHGMYSEIYKQVVRPLFARNDSDESELLRRPFDDEQVDDGYSFPPPPPRVDDGYSFPPPPP